jgi:hypothetical protein
MNHEPALVTKVTLSLGIVNAHEWARGGANVLLWRDDVQNLEHLDPYQSSAYSF